MLTINQTSTFTSILPVEYLIKDDASISKDTVIYLLNMNNI